MVCLDALGAAASPDASAALPRQRAVQQKALGLCRRAAAYRHARWQAAQGRGALLELPGMVRTSEGAGCLEDPLAALMGAAGQEMLAQAAPWLAAAPMVVRVAGALVAAAGQCCMLGAARRLA